MKEIIGANIKRIRRSKNLSAEKLGDMLNVTSGAIYSYESGKSEPPLATIEKLAKCLGTTKEELMGIQILDSELKSENEALKKEVLWLKGLIDKLAGPTQQKLTNFLKALSQAGAALAAQLRVAA